MPASRCGVANAASRDKGDVVLIRPATIDDLGECVSILGELPGYFNDNQHEEIRCGGDQRAWVAVDHGEVVGFTLVKVTFGGSAMITLIAIRPSRRRQGIGTRLVERVLEDLAAECVVLVSTTALDETAEHEQRHVAVRHFWERRGFVQIHCVDPLPGSPPGNPSAIYVAAL